MSFWEQLKATWRLLPELGQRLSAIEATLVQLRARIARLERIERLEYESIERLREANGCYVDRTGQYVVLDPNHERWPDPAQDFAERAKLRAESSRLFWLIEDEKSALPPLSEGT